MEELRIKENINGRIKNIDGRIKKNINGRKKYTDGIIKN